MFEVSLLICVWGYTLVLHLICAWGLSPVPYLIHCAGPTRSPQRHYARAAGIDVTELNCLEVLFVSVLDFDLHVSPAEILAVYSELSQT